MRGDNLTKPTVGDLLEKEEPPRHGRSSRAPTSAAGRIPSRVSAAGRCRRRGEAEMNTSSLTIDAESPPLRVANGVIFVGKTRVPLDTVVECHLEGLSPEQIVDAYDVIPAAEAGRGDRILSAASSGDR